MPVFAGCQPRRLAQIARLGDVVEVGRGDVLVREDHTDYWFFVILSGSARVASRGHTVATLHRGDHFGEIAIIGFRPQQATVTALEPCVLFVLGRSPLLSLAATDASIQRALFPAVATGSYSAFVRELQAEGRRHWERLVPPERRTPSWVARRVAEASRTHRPGLALSWAQALDLLAQRDLRRLPPEPTTSVTATSGRRIGLVVTAVGLSAFVALALVYHPPVAVVTAGRAIDVVQDISITGAHARKPSGRYLLTPVDVDRPSFAGMIVARARGLTIVGTDSPGARELDPARARRAAHDAFLRSHRLAISLAEKLLGAEAAGAGIAIRDRGINGPSAGLIYALAITDMLAADDLAHGRAIAATGELKAEGVIGAVAFVSLKADAARRAGAKIFFVPSSQRGEAKTSGLDVLGVGHLKEAVLALRRES
jgi:CRP-like cAMP-binding protein